MSKLRKLHIAKSKSKKNWVYWIENRRFAQPIGKSFQEALGRLRRFKCL